MNQIINSTGKNFTFILIFVAALLQISAENLSCQNRCCKGQNSSCVSHDSVGNKKCYCDAFCYRSKDCCHDFKQFCRTSQKVNCVLSNWTPWTKCTRNCGQGFQFRSRKIIFPPKNNGRKCDSLRDVKTCHNVLCPVQKFENRKRKLTQHSKMTSSVAQLLPDSGIKADIYKHYNHKYDIRQHLYRNSLHQLNITEQSDTPYCAFYKIIFTFGSCDNFQKLKKIDRANWSQHFLFLQKDRKICATCYSENKYKELSNQCQGTGLLYKPTRWRAIRSDNCHGYFKLIHKRKNCSCPPNSFIMI